jgi:hypothetical protein
MKTEFNLIPPEYNIGALASLRRRGVHYLPLILICLAAAEFMIFSLLELPHLRGRLERASAGMNKAVRRTELLTAQYTELNREIMFWQNVLEKAEKSVPALEITDVLCRFLPETAELQNFTVDSEALQIKVLFADPKAPDLFLRRTAKLSYGPVRVLERRVTPHGSLFFRFGASKK